MANCFIPTESLFNYFPVAELPALFSGCIDCQDNWNSLPSGFKTLVLNTLNYYSANPTGVFADFNYIYKLYKFAFKLASDGLICINDLPAPPDPSDYPDIESDPITNAIIETDLPGPYKGATTGIIFRI